jgi:hypothetical protein
MPDAATLDTVADTTAVARCAAAVGITVAAASMAEADPTVVADTAAAGTGNRL